MAVAKRCHCCLKKLRKDGTCSNKDCPRYVLEETTEDKSGKDKK